MNPVPQGLRSVQPLGQGVGYPSRIIMARSNSGKNMFSYNIKRRVIEEVNLKLRKKGRSPVNVDPKLPERVTVGDQGG